MIAGNQEDELSNLIETPLPVVTPDTDVPELSLLMSDYNLTGMPVVDQNGRPIGVVSVDDLLEQLLPEEWRRRSGAARG
jgi:Mg/Co/Ni transporter MgtE